MGIANLAPHCLFAGENSSLFLQILNIAFLPQSQQEAVERNGTMVHCFEKKKKKKKVKDDHMCALW